VGPSTILLEISDDPMEADGTTMFADALVPDECLLLAVSSPLLAELNPLVCFIYFCKGCTGIKVGRASPMLSASGVGTNCKRKSVGREKVRIKRSKATEKKVFYQCVGNCMF
jgi:hypothetical protein